MIRTFPRGCTNGPLQKRGKGDTLLHGLHREAGFLPLSLLSRMEGAVLAKFSEIFLKFFKNISSLGDSGGFSAPGRVRFNA